MTRLHVLLVLAFPLAALPALACGMEVEDDSISLASLMADIEGVATAVFDPPPQAPVEVEAIVQHEQGLTLPEADPLAVGSVEAASLRPVAAGS